MEKAHMEVLLEDIRSKFDLVLEGHEALRGEIQELGRKTGERFDLVDFKIDTLNQKIDAVRSELKEDIASVRSELKEDIASVRSELKEDIALVRSELKEEIRAVATDLSAHRHDTEAHGNRYLASE